VEHLTAKSKKSQGAHYTPPELAQFVAKQVVAAWLSVRAEHGEGISPFTILDPAVGGGELLEAIHSELPTTHRSAIRMVGMDNDPIAVANARTRLSSVSQNTLITQGDFLESLTGNETDLFQEEETLRDVDLIIANPPYVRTQVLGAKKAQALAEKFGLLGRVDLSFPFILGIVEKLRPSGVAGIITSNRFLSTRAGASLRERLRCATDIIHIWDLGDTKLFEAAVLPCILLVRKAPPRGRALFTSCYSVSPKERRPDPSKLFSNFASGTEGVVELGNGSSQYEIKRGKLEYSAALDAVWKLRNGKSSAWAERVKRSTWKTLGELTKVRVGVKTTADQVFIRSDWKSECPGGVPETLRPLITHHLAKRFRGQRPEKQILYTHEMVDGRKRAIQLDCYPYASYYLNRHQTQLKARKYVEKAGREWFEIWVPQEPSAWDHPKIVFKDIAVKPTFWLETEGSVVNGDCYWFSFGNGLTDLYWLSLGVFNSTFIERFYDTHFANKLYSGRRRFMTQYVSEFPLPDPASRHANKIVKIARELYDCPERENELIQDLDSAVAVAFGLSVKET
jgi:hypothetical protein